jgi:hypothetical protein
MAMAVALVWAGCSGSGDDDDTYNPDGTGGSTGGGTGQTNTGGRANTTTGGRGNTTTGGRGNTTTGYCPTAAPDDGSTCSEEDSPQLCTYGNVTCACNSDVWNCVGQTGATGGRSNATGGRGNATGGQQNEAGGTGPVTAGSAGDGEPAAGAPPESTAGSAGAAATLCPLDQPRDGARCSGSQMCSYDGFDCACRNNRWRCTEVSGAGGTGSGEGGSTQTEGGSTQTEGGSTQTEGGSTGAGGAPEPACKAQPPRDGNGCDPAGLWCDYPDADPAALVCFCSTESGWQCHAAGATEADCEAQPPRDGNGCDHAGLWCDYPDANPALTCYCDASGWQCGG